MITTFDENYIASAYDEDLNLGTEFFDLGDCYNILFCAWSRAGKGVFINYLLTRDLIHRLPSIKNLYIFSPTFKDDKSFAPVRNLMYKRLTDQDIKTHIQDTIDFETISQIIAKQNEIKTHNDELRWKKLKMTEAQKTGTISQQQLKKLDKYVILIDDLLDSRDFTSFFGGLSGLCTKNRHWNIVFLFSGQHFTKISPVIRAQSDLIFLGFMHPLSDLMFRSLADSNKVKALK